MLFFLFFSYFSFALIQSFDESPVACSQKETAKMCSLVFVGDKAEEWVGHLILAKRGKSGDINEFIKDTKKFAGKIKKTKLSVIYKDKIGLLNLSGYLEYNKPSKKWIGHLEAQFTDRLDFIDKRNYIFEDIYAVK